MKLQIRWLIRRDLKDVIDIEWLCFEHAWFEGDFLNALAQRNCIGMAAECGGMIRGYMIYELHKSRLEVLNFAVHPDWQRRGVGTAMVDRLKTKLSQQRRQEIRLWCGNRI